MRWTKGRKFSTADQQDAGVLAKQYGFEADTVLDIATLLRQVGGGLVSVGERMRRMRKVPWEDRQAEMATYNMLDDLRRWQAFPRFCKFSNVMRVTERLLTLFNALAAKRRQSICGTCLLQKQCPYGQYFAGKSKTIGDTHKDCPRLLDMNTTQSPAANVLAGLATLVAMCHPAMVGAVTWKSPGMADMLVSMGMPMGMASYGAGKGNSFDATFTGEDMCARLQELVNRLTKAEMQVFELARVLDHTITKGKQKKLKASPDPEKQEKNRQMQAVEDVFKVAPGALALPAPVVAFKTATKGLTVRQDMKPDVKKNLYYVLIDVSGSMSSAIRSNPHGMFSRAHMAAALAMAVVKKSFEEKGIIYVRFFESVPGPRYRAETPSEFVDLSRRIGLGDSSGGGTSIEAALRSAFNDIKSASADGNIKKAEVLLISDGCDSVSESMVRSRGSVKLHVLQICGYKGEEANNGSYQIFVKAADTVMSTDPTEPDLSKIAHVV